MGIFGKIVESRTQAVLKNHFGTEVPFDLVAGGKGSLHGSSINLRPFMCAFTEFGLIFIHEARIVLAVGWERILQSHFNNQFGSLSLLIQLNQVNEIHSNLEYPWRNYFTLDIAFNNSVHTEFFLDKYYSKWSAVGATKEGLELVKYWNKYVIRKPVLFDDYLKANENWKESNEIKAESYAIWGETIDAEKLLYYVANGICRGFLPPRLIDEALEILVESQSKNSKFTNIDLEVSVSEREMVEQLKLLPDNSNMNSNSSSFTGWAFGKIDGRFDPELPTIPTPMRWTIFNLTMSEGMPVMRIWDTFFKGEEVIYLADKKDKKNFVGHLMGKGVKFEVNGEHARTFMDFYTY